MFCVFCWNCGLGDGLGAWFSYPSIDRWAQKNAPHQSEIILSFWQQGLGETTGAAGPQGWASCQMQGRYFAFAAHILIWGRVLSGVGALTFEVTSGRTHFPAVTPAHWVAVAHRGEQSIPPRYQSGQGYSDLESQRPQTGVLFPT